MMGEVHRLPRYRLTQEKLEGFGGFAYEAPDGVLEITVSDLLTKEQAHKEARRIRRVWRRLNSLPVAAAGWVRHAARAAGRHSGPTLTVGAAAGVAAGAMLVVVSSAPIPPQAARPAVMAPQGGLDVEADPLPVPPPVKPVAAWPGSVPAAPRGHVGTSGLPASQGPVASALASAGVSASSHPLRPVRQMLPLPQQHPLVALGVRPLVSSIVHKLPVPAPRHPLQCHVQITVRGGKTVSVRICI